MDGEAKITGPVAACLGVRDIARSGAFYRDVLGFAIRENAEGTEALRGPARIRLAVEGRASGDWDRPRPPGSAVVFLQTDDVSALRSAIHACGGAPSQIEKVNWIKMSMFEVRDPDGHVLWFGQTYREEQDSPSCREPQPRGLRQALPNLPFDDVAAAVTYYCEVFGFRINYQQEDFGVLDRDAITILLIARTAQHTGIESFEVYVDDADALYGELLAKGARTQGEPVSYRWGLRSFRVLDLEGNRITFAQPFE